MAVRTVDELLASVKEVVGDAITSDKGISLLEDITDSYKTDGEDWKAKYEENDATWRKRYADRFSGKGEGVGAVNSPITEGTVQSPITEIEVKVVPEPQKEEFKTLEDVFDWKED